MRVPCTPALGRLLFWVGLFLASCQSEPEPIPVTDIIELEVADKESLQQAGQLRADGLTKITLLARLPLTAAEANRLVVFTTSAGEFDVTGTDRKTTTALATRLSPDDTRLTARVQLTLGTVSGRYTLKAGIQSQPLYTAEESVDVLPLSTNSFLRFYIVDKATRQGQVRADGRTTLRLVATVPKTAPEAGRTIEFRTSAGTLDVAADNKKLKQVYATLANATDTVFTATALLTVDTTPGDYLLSAAVTGQAAYRAEEVFTVLPVAAADLLSIALEPASDLRADGLTLFKVVTTLQNTPVKSVVVSTTGGTILNSATPQTKVQPVDQSGRAELSIQVGTEVKDYLITAQLENSPQYLTRMVSLDRAYPDSIILEPSALSIDTVGGFVSLDAYLLRERGKVSQGTLVQATAYQVNPQQARVPAGRFTGGAPGTDATGKLTLRFYADTGRLSAASPVILEITSRTDAGSLVRQQVRLRLK